MGNIVLIHSFNLDRCSMPVQPMFLPVMTAVPSDPMLITLGNGTSSSDITSWMYFAIPAPVVSKHSLFATK